MLVGRESEVATLADAVHEASEARGAAIVVRGEPGIGKTALLDALAARSDDTLILRALGVETETALAYAGLSELLAPALELLPRLPERRRVALEAALGLSDATLVDAFGAYAATLSLLAEAAGERPVLVLVDDAHLLDAESAGALRFSARRLVHDRVCIVLAMREGKGVDFEASGFASLRLGGLDREAAMALLSAAGRIAPDVRDELHRATGGNPLALREAARLLTAEQLAGSAPLPDHVPVGPDVARAFGARIEALPDVARQALVLAAADDEVVVVQRALRLRGLGLDALARAEAAGLVAVDGGRVRFSHPLIRTAAYGGAGSNVRREAHAALAAAIRGDAARRVRRAWHEAAAAIEPDERLAGELEEIAANFSDRAAPAAAGRALETAARVGDAGEARVRRLLSAAGAQHRAGAAGRALRLLDHALAEAGDPLQRADAQRLRATIEVFKAAPGSVRALLLEEARRVEPHDPARAAAMRLDAAMASIILGEPRTALRLAEQAWPVASEAGDPLRTFATLVLGAGRILCGDIVHGYPLIREIARVVAGGELAALGAFAGELSMYEICAGRAESAREQLDAVVTRLRAEGTLSWLPSALGGLAWADMVLGDWRAAEAAANESVAIAQELGQPALELPPRTILALLAGAQGRLDEGRALALEVMERGREYGVGSTRTMAGWALGRLELGAGDHEAAVAILEPTGRFSLERGLEEPGVAPWAQDLAEAYIRLGRGEEGEATLELLERQAERTGGRLAHAGALRCRGLLAADAELDAPFRGALAWHDGLTDPFERARTELCYGERLRRAGRRADARAQLRAALAAFEELGAEPWAQRAVTELRGTGERARRRTPDTIDQLTPQERQVAALVAEGVTNREAAAALFLSPRTIETHLSHVYRKLGLRSRAELASRLRGSQAA